MAAVAFFARRPTLARAAIGLTIALGGLCLYPFVEARRPARDQAASEPPRQAAAISPRLPAVDERANPGAAASAVTARRADEAPAPAKAAVQNKPIVTQRDPALESWFIKSYLRCWTPPSTLPPGEKYAAQICVVHNIDGSLSTPPQLVNPPSDPEWRAYADSAVRAVARCNPLQVPARYVAHFDQWRKMTLHFSPDSTL